MTDSNTWPRDPASPRPISKERMLVLARFLRSQVALADRPPVGRVELNNEEAEVCALALEGHAHEPSAICKTCGAAFALSGHHLCLGLWPTPPPPVEQPAPVRACRLVLDLQADSREDLLRTLEDVVCRIDRKELTTGCSGGYNSGYTHEYTENAGPTHDEYALQLKDYLAASRPTKVPD